MSFQSPSDLNNFHLDSFLRRYIARREKNVDNKNVLNATYKDNEFAGKSETLSNVSEHFGSLYSGLNTLRGYIYDAAEKPQGKISREKFPKPTLK